MAIKELKKHNATTRSNPPPKRAVTTHDTDPSLEQPPTDTPTGDPPPPPPPQIPLQILIWTTLNPVKPSPLMTPPLSTSWIPILPHTLSIKPISTMCLNTLLLTGNTIHSPGQIEWFQNTCDDKSFHVGGKQVIHFLDGYSTPLQCSTGLMYMSLLGNLQMLTLTPIPMCYLLVPMNGTLLSWTTPTLPPLETPPGLQTLPVSVPMKPGLMNLAILRGEFSIPSSATLLNTNMLSPLNPLTLRS